MAKKIVLAKKKRGPPPTGKGTQIVVRMQPAPLDALDGWISHQADRPTRAEAIRRLVEFGLGKAAIKRRLVKGPEEFQNVRRDRPNRK